MLDPSHRWVHIVGDRVRDVLTDPRILVEILGVEQVLVGESGGRFGFERQQRNQEPFAVATHDRTANDVDAHQCFFNVLRCDVLAARGDDDVLLATDDREIAIGVERSKVA